MLTSWYFCCCLNFPLKQTLIFLDISEILEAPEAQEDLLELAIQELARTNAWMQIFSLPRVIDLCNDKRVSETFILKDSLYIDRILNYLPDDIRYDLGKLLEAIVKERQEQHDLETFSRALKVVTELRISDPGEHPYIDLREFLPHTLLLIALDIFSRHAPRFEEHFQEKFPTLGKSLGILLERSLSRMFGRQSFCLALKIQRRFSSFLDGQQAITYLTPDHSFNFTPRTNQDYRQPRIDPTLEPDLMESYICSELLGDPNSTDSKKNYKLITESQLLTKLRELNPELHRKKGWFPIMKILKRPNTVEEREALSVIFWQCTLWEKAIEIDAAAGSEALAGLWAVDPVPVDNKLLIRGPVAKKELNSWRRQVKSLARLSGRTWHNNFSIRVERDKDLSIQKGTKAILFSPWFSHDKRAKYYNTFKTKKGPQVRYHVGQNYPAFLRLLIVAGISVKCLQFDRISQDVQLEHARIVVHVSDVLRQYSYLKFYTGLKSELPSDKNLRIDNTLRTLVALSAHTQKNLNHTGTGHRPNVPPETFVNIAPLPTSVGNEIKPSKELYFFTNHVLPQQLLEWANNAYGGASNNSGPGRWLPYIANVTNDAQATSEKPIMTVCLLKRFFVKDSLEEGAFDWREDLKHNENNQKKLYHRNLLLSPSLHASEWEREEWHEEQLKPIYLLIRAAERVASLDASSSQELRERWTKEFAELLGEISSVKELDRYFRLRLLELLIHPSLLQEEELKISMALILLEFGSLYDQKELIDIFFPVATDDWLSQDPVRWRVRSMLLKAVTTKLAKEKADKSKSSWAQSPYERIREQKRRDLFSEAVKRAALASTKLNSPEAEIINDSIVRVLRQLRPQKPVGKRIISASILTRADKKILVLPPKKHSRMIPALTRAITVDPNRFVAQIHTDDFDFDVCDLNLFTMDRNELRQFYNVAGMVDKIERNTISVPAVVTERLGNKYTFYCGLPWYYYYTSKHIRYVIKKGDWVKLPLQAVPSNNSQLRWQIARGEHIGKLPFRVANGSTRKFHVATKGGDGCLPVVLQRYNRAVPKNKWLPKVWDADLSRAFSKINHNQEVIAVWNDRCWNPVDGGLSDLLLEGEVNEDRVIIILCLLKMETKFLRVSSAPGSNYKLFSSDFDNESWIRITNSVNEIIEQGEDYSGLLIVVESSYLAGEIRLQLRSERLTINNIERRYPKLCVPFDYRNLQWRKLFENKELEIPEASRDNHGKWWIELKQTMCVAGFPERILVYLSGRTTNDNSIEIEVTSWKPEKAIVEGKQVETNRLELGSSPEKILQQWLELRQNSRLQLDRTIGKVRDNGYVTCLTSHGFIVRCEAETITMKKTSTKDRIPIHGTRDALVVSQRWFKSDDQLVIDPEELPDAVKTDGRGEAVFVRVPRRGQSGSLCHVYWITDDGFFKADLRVQNLHQCKNVGAGTKLNVQYSGNHWHFAIEKQHVLVRALWQQVDWDPKFTSVFSLGVTTINDKRRFVVETTAGKFALLDPSSKQNVNHLAVYDSKKINKTGLPPNWTGNNIIRKNIIWSEGRKRYSRCLLHETSQDDYVLPANCRADDPTGRVTIARVRINLSKVSGNYFTLRRFFDLESQSSPKILKNKDKDKKQEQQFLIMLEEAIAERTELTGIVKDDYFEQNIPVPDGKGGWTRHIRIAPNEGVYVTTANYPRSATMVLFRDAKQELFASMRRVSPFNVEQFREEVGAGYNETTELLTPLYYVGRENCVNGNEDNPCHRLEWGHGLTLLVAENDLLFNGEPFSVSEPVIFHGDAIISVQFLHSNTRDSNDGASHTILDIDELSIRTSQSTTVFLQRRKFNMVHLLQIRTQGDKILITRVAGFDRNRDTDQRWFDRIEARLDDNSIERLRKRFPLSAVQSNKKDETETTKELILGRLDDDLYLNSLGKTVLFHHVVFSFASGDEKTALRPGEIVFMQMGRIEHIGKNDIGVWMQPPQNLSEKDKGSDLKNLLIMRRTFSPRPSLLPRILKRHGPDALKGKYILVRVTRYGDDKPRANFLYDEFPRRSDTTIASLIQAQQAPVYCAVNKIDVNATPTPSFFCPACMS